MSDPVFSILLPVDLKTQNNGQGRSWHSSAGQRRKFERLLCGEHRREPLEYPVDVTYTRVCGPKQRARDCDNIAPSCKQLQDALVALGWWHDDTPTWIRSVTYKNDDTRREDGPAVLVEAWKVADY